MYRKEKRIPTIFGLLIIFIGLGSLMYFDQASHNVNLSAKENFPPEDIHFSNISDNSFTISWLSNKLSTGYAVIKDQSASQILLDDLDTDNIARPRTTHFITVKNLKEETTYEVKIINGNLNCTNKLFCPVYNQKTATKLPLFSEIPPVRGKILDENGQAVQNALIYITIGKNMLLSGRSDSSGLWVIPLSNLRSNNLSDHVEISDNDIIQITAKTSLNKISTAIVDVKSIKQNLSIPDMKLGNSYNFINLISKKDLIAKSNNKSILGQQIKKKITITPTPEVNNLIDILFPDDQDNNATVDPQPRIRGIGPAGISLIITINSIPQVGKVKIKPDNTWDWRPLKPLPPGTHYINVEGYNSSGKFIKISRKLYILKSGESVLGEATGSSDLAESSPTPTLTPTPTIISVTPTIFLSPTIEPTIEVSNITSPSPTTYETPRTGITESTFVLIGIGITLFLFGIKILSII